MGLVRHRDALRQALPRPIFQIGAALHRQLPRSRRDRRGLEERMDISRAVHVRCGGVVQRGPFKGMRLPEVTADSASKCVGSYEMELYPTLLSQLAAGPRCVVDVGCAEGFYAVGPAIRLPDVEVWAFDISGDAQERCRRTAAANGVADRVRVGGECTAELLAKLAAPGSLVIMDIEGAELQLLEEPETLAEATLVVELHEFAASGLTDTLLHRFGSTHAIELISSRSRGSGDVESFPELDVVDEEDQMLALFERPMIMQWAVMSPRERTVRA